MSIEVKLRKDPRENKGFSVENQASQFDVLQDISNLQKEAGSRRSKIEQSIDQRNVLLQGMPNLQDISIKSQQEKIDKAIDKQRESYRKKLTEVRERQRKELHPDKPEKVHIEKSEQSLKIGENYIYKKTTKSYFDITTGTPITKITIRVEGKDHTPVETKTRYSGEASGIARMCSSKMDDFIQNNYHDALAQAKLKIEEEMAPQYAELGSTPDPAAKASLDTERNEKIAEVEKKAGAALRKFLDKYGGRHMNAELLDELQWVEGMEACARDIKSRIAGAENKLKTSVEELQKITEEINGKIKEMQRLLSSSSATLSESHALSGSNHPSSSEASALSHNRLTLENVDQKIEAYLKNPTSRGLSDHIYKEILSLATDESKYPESMASEDKQKLRKTLLDIGLKLVERQYKMDEPFEMLEKWERYTASHYGKRLMYERQLVDHLDEVAKAASEHAVAIHEEREWIMDVDRYYKAAGKANVHPLFSDRLSADLSAQFEATLAQIQEASDQTEQRQHIATFVDLARQVQNILQQPNSLRTSLESLEKAHTKALEKQQHYEHVKAITGKIQKLVELEKDRDDVNDMLDMSKVKAIKETDKTTLKHLRTWELEMVKHFNAHKHEDHKALNKEEEEIRQFFIHLEKIDIGNLVQLERMTKMYWLAFFGSGDQAALFSLGRESTAQFSSFMSLFR